MAPKPKKLKTYDEFIGKKKAKNKITELEYANYIAENNTESPFHPSNTANKWH